jgi:UDP-N-acetylmuramoyl-tripeptide--D-alanyl-D-alanine ligase
MGIMVERKGELFTIKEVGEILGSRLEGDPGFHLTSVRGIKIDSREIENDDLFIAVMGSRFDGHDFIESALSNGAVAAVVSRREAEVRKLYGNRYIAVDDTIHALGELARHHRNRLDVNVVAVTGSNGKTTVKNLVYEILSQNGPTLKSPANYNNFFGLPLSIFQVDSHHKSAVLELGMSAKGEISRLAEIASPNVAVITNVGPVHLEFFNDIDEIAAAKLEILERIKPGGTLIVNGDDEILMGKLRQGDFEITRFGLSQGNHIYPQDLIFEKHQLPSFKISGTAMRSNLPGVHNVYNILAAFAVSNTLRIAPESAAAAIARYRSDEMRSEIINKKGITFIIDCYNANPVSMKYALDTLARMECGGRRVAVLGDMLELGQGAGMYHKQIGAYASEKGIDSVFCNGPLSRIIAESFGEGAYHFDSQELLAERLLKKIAKGDIVLFKASRGIALENIANQVMESL